MFRVGLAYTAEPYFLWRISAISYAPIIDGFSTVTLCMRLSVKDAMVSVELSLSVKGVMVSVVELRHVCDYKLRIRWSQQSYVM